jgi:transposase
VLDDLARFLDATLPKLSGKSELAAAIRYARSRWAPLARYVDDGRLEMTNNAAERAIRPLALGRKNWTFAGSDRGGERAAAIYTLIETAMCGWPPRCKGKDGVVWRKVGSVHVSGL